METDLITPYILDTGPRTRPEDVYETATLSLWSPLGTLLRGVDYPDAGTRGG